MYISYYQTLRATCEVGVILSVFPKIESLRDLTKTAQGQHWLQTLRSFPVHNDVTLAFHECSLCLLCASYWVRAHLLAS